MITAQDGLFPIDRKPLKSYRALRHEVVRKRQADNCATTTHPTEKSAQIRSILHEKTGLSTLELFAGNGNLSTIYSLHGSVLCFDKKLGTGDSFTEYHRLIADRRKFDVIDLDPYGFPSRFFPDIFLLIDNGFLFVTCPIPSVNILHDITKTHLQVFYGSDNPSIEQISVRIAEFGLCHWRQVELIDCIKIDRMYRLAFKVMRVKSTEYTGVNNRARTTP
jgi:hypothetical protein